MRLTLRRRPWWASGRRHKQPFEIDSFLVPGRKWCVRAYRCCYAFDSGAARLLGRLRQNLECSDAPCSRGSSRGRVKERRGTRAAASLSEYECDGCARPTGSESLLPAPFGHRLTREYE